MARTESWREVSEMSNRRKAVGVTEGRKRAGGKELLEAVGATGRLDVKGLPEVVDSSKLRKPVEV